MTFSHLPQFIISIHAPRVGSDFSSPGSDLYLIRISIHAPRVGSDYEALARGGSRYISIHAPRVGSDLLYPLRGYEAMDFNPRSPCGERR